MQQQKTNTTAGQSADPLTSAGFHILLAEDDAAMRQLLEQTLRKNGFFVTECKHGIELLAQLQAHLSYSLPVRYDLAISDIWLPGVSGMSVFEGLHDLEGFPPMIIITAFGDEETHERARRLGVVAVLDKPFELDLLMEQVHRVAEDNARGSA
jgi:CheY-like chemotaxis protein